SVGTIGQDDAKRMGDVFIGLPRLSILGEDWRPTLQRVEETHVLVAAELRALANSGGVKVGLRAWLAAATGCDWNRFGLPNRLGELASAIAEAKGRFAPDGGSVCLVRGPAA